MGLILQYKLPKTQLAPITEERMREAYQKIDRDVLNSWRFFGVKNNVLFEGSPRMCFWAGKECGKGKAIRPAVKEAIKRVLQATADDCREHGLAPDSFMQEAAYLLKGLVESVCREMIEIDRRLRGRGFPQEVGRVSMDDPEVSSLMPELERYIDGQAAALSFLASAAGKKTEKADGGGGSEADAAPAEKWWRPAPLAQDEVREIRAYAETLSKLSEGVDIEIPEPRVEGYDYSGQERYDYARAVLELVGDCGFDPIHRILRRNFPDGTVRALERKRDEILRRTKGDDWVNVYKGRVQPNFGTGTSIDAFVQELLEEVEHAEAAVLLAGGAEGRDEFLGGVIQRLKALRTVLKTKRGNLDEAREELTTFIRTPERLIETLDDVINHCKPKGDTRTRIQEVRAALVTYRRLYPAVCDPLADDRVIAEFERLQGMRETPTLEMRNTLEEGTGFWTITFQGRKLPAIQGREAFAYVAYVLTKPKEWLPALRVVEAVQQRESEMPRQSEDQGSPEEEAARLGQKPIKYKDSENMADRTYLEQCWAELSRLRTEQGRAKANGDEAAAQACLDEFNKIRKEVRELTRPGGRFTKFADSVDKAYEAVRKAIERVIKRVEEHSPELAQHLKNCIHFDKPCISYQPEKPTEWQWVKPRGEKKS